MKRFARALRRARREHRDQRQGRRAEALLRRGRAARRRLGGVLPRRRQAAPGGADACCCARSRCRARRHRRLAVRRVLPGGRRPRRDHRARAAAAGARRATSAWPTGSRSACCRCAAWRPRSRPQRVAAYWDELDSAGRFLLNKLIGGGFRVGVSKLLVQRALAEGAGIDAKLRRAAHDGLHRRPRDAERRALRCSSPRRRDAGPLDIGQPYPFFLAHPLDAAARASSTARLGAPADWLVEWKYDGIRAQVVKRAGQVWIWSRGEELVTERFPELVALGAARCPTAPCSTARSSSGRTAGVAPFALLQQRIGRKTLTKKVLADAPVALHRLRPARSAAASTCASGRSTSGARCSRRCSRDAARRSALSPLETRAELGTTSPRCATRRARAASRA